MLPIPSLTLHFKKTTVQLDGLKLGIKVKADAGHTLGIKPSCPVSSMHLYGLARRLENAFGASEYMYCHIFTARPPCRHQGWPGWAAAAQVRLQRAPSQPARPPASSPPPPLRTGQRCPCSQTLSFARQNRAGAPAATQIDDISRFRRVHVRCAWRDRRAPLTLNCGSAIVWSNRPMTKAVMVAGSKCGNAWFSSVAKSCCRNSTLLLKCAVTQPGVCQPQWKTEFRSQHLPRPCEIRS